MGALGAVPNLREDAMSGKLRRTLVKNTGQNSFHCTSTGRDMGFHDTVSRALAVINKPIPGPLALWVMGLEGRPNGLCIGEVGAWKAKPSAYGRWDDLWPVFESYARML